MSTDMDQFFQGFCDETEDLLAEKERLLLAIDVAAPAMENIDAIFRVAHSIKGGAATFGLNDITEVTHLLESLLDRIRKGEMALTVEHVDAFLVAKDTLKMQLDGHRHGTPVDQDAAADVRASLLSLSQGFDLHGLSAASHAGSDAARRFRIELPEASGKDAGALAEELGLLGTIDKTVLADGRHVFILDTAEDLDGVLAICSFIIDPDELTITEEPAAQPAKENARDPIETSASGAGPQADFSSNGAATGPADAMPAAKRHADREVINQESSSIRVSVEKVDQLLNLVGELVITQAMIEQRTNALDPMLHERLLNSVSQLTRNMRDLQEAAMSIRMMPMDSVFSRFPRMVRDLAAKLGKKVDFVTYGAATELDKSLIERIVDPLTHLVRNSIDHGIEMPSARIAAGKPEAGTLTLSAAHQGGNIVIEVSDDGAGLNRERILSKAMQQGLAASETMSDREVWQLIFAPGFSTAETVTDVSGRGVGMDVVARNISAMGGVVDIRSVKGAGSTISISLPLTLAILDGMSIKVGDEVYILPLSYVIESLQPPLSDVKEIAGQGRVVKVRGEYLPLIPLYQMFDIEPRFTDPSEGIVVILESEGKKAGLFIDELVGQQQVVVKNLESNYRKVAGISGATILGDGGVSLILDVSALLRSSRQLNAEPVPSQ